MSDHNKAIIDEFRANEGKVGGYFAGKPMLLLHTTGAKTGLERVNPVITFIEGDKYVIVASKGGAPEDPDWYKNLVAHPEVEVEYGTERFSATASVVKDEAERKRLYEKMETVMPSFTEYKTKTTRAMPVITLTRK